MDNQTSSGNHSAEKLGIERIPVASQADFDLRGVIGDEVQAITYQAEYKETGEQVALKVAKENASARIARETDLLASLDHPNIVPVRFRSSSDEQAFFAMPLLRNLANLSPKKQIAALAGIAQGLDYAHENGIVHGDIKPSHFMVDEDDGGVLIDFGYGARISEPNPPEYTGGMTYMAPEVAAPGRATERSDQYSFAVAVYQTLFGRTPSKQAPPLPSVGRAMSEDPSQRFEAVYDFIQQFANEVGKLPDDKPTVL